MDYKGCILIWLCWVTVSKAEPDVEHRTFRAGSTVRLPCTLRSQLMFSWCKIDDPLSPDEDLAAWRADPDNGRHCAETTDASSSLETRQFIHGNATLELRNIQPTDEALYVCFSYRTEVAVNLTVYLPLDEGAVDVTLPQYVSDLDRTINGKIVFNNVKPPISDLQCDNVQVIDSTPVYNTATRTYTQTFRLVGGIDGLQQHKRLLCTVDSREHQDRVTVVNQEIRVGYAPQGTPTIVIHPSGDLECSDAGVTPGEPADVTYKWKVDGDITTHTSQLILSEQPNVPSRSVYQCQVMNAVGGSEWSPEMSDVPPATVAEVAGMDQTILMGGVGAGLVGLLVVLIILLAVFISYRKKQKSKIASLRRSSSAASRAGPDGGPVAGAGVPSCYLTPQGRTDFRAVEHIYEDIPDKTRIEPYMTSDTKCYRPPSTTPSYPQGYKTMTLPRGTPSTSSCGPPAHPHPSSTLPRASTPDYRTPTPDHRMVNPMYGNDRASGPPYDNHPGTSYPRSSGVATASRDYMLRPPERGSTPGADMAVSRSPEDRGRPRTITSDGYMLPQELIPEIEYAEPHKDKLSHENNAPATPMSPRYTKLESEDLISQPLVLN